jgi:hypothetical protein
MSSFTDAYSTLQRIHQRLSSQDIVDIDELLMLQHDAKNAYDICIQHLYREDLSKNNVSL